MVKSSLSLADLDGRNGFRLDGIDSLDLSGGSVSAAGDVNGDGIDDVIIGARLADPDGKSDAGESYVVFGTTGGFGASLSLGDLDGSNGFRFDGIDAGDRSGISVSAAGDVNGDGIDDVIIGASSADPDGKRSAGESYVVFGTTAGFGASLSLADLDGSNGFRLDGLDAGDRSGISVSAAGDVNGDGIDDVIIGANGADPDGNRDAGEIYVVFGSDGGFGASLSLAALDGSNGFRLDGIVRNDDAGSSVSLAGDVNGDGIDDVIIGARSAGFEGAAHWGETYVVFGSDNGFDASPLLEDLGGGNGFRLYEVKEFEQSGSSVSSAGDVNGDGIDDVIIGAFLENQSYLVFGSDSGFDASLSLADLDGSNGFRIDGIDVRDGSGRSVSAAGDVNADGIDDVIIGASGESYVVFGSDGGFDASLSLADLDGSNGFRLEGQSGTSVSSAGDVNGDGIDDVIIGASSADPDGQDRAGASYVVFGENAEPVAIDDALRTNQNTPVSGNVLADNGNGADRDDLPRDLLLVISVDGATDAIGNQITLPSGALLTLDADGAFAYDPTGAFDGLADRTLTTDSFTYQITDRPGEAPGASATVTLTIIGADPGRAFIAGTPGPDRLSGTVAPQDLDGGRGNDTVDGGGGRDTLFGGADDDQVFGDAAKAAYYGATPANQAYRLYHATQDSAPDPDDHAMLAGQLRTGEQTLLALADELVETPGFLQTYPDDLSDTALVTLLYNNVLGRDPDAQGLARWTADLAGGASRSELVLGLAQSPEYIADTTKAANNFAFTSLDSNWSDDVFRLYQATLDRTPDVRGQDRWTGELASGTSTLVDVADGFVRSPQFKQTFSDTLSDGDFVTLLYNNVLGRDPDAQGFARWTGELAGGASRAEVVLGFSQSPQFQADTAAALKQWMRAQGEHDRIAAGPGNDLVAGGQYADAFVFAPGETGRTTVADLEPWDFLDLSGFGYGSAAEARAQMSQQGDDVLFAAQGTEALFRFTALNEITDDMILV